MNVSARKCFSVIPHARAQCLNNILRTPITDTSSSWCNIARIHSSILIKPLPTATQYSIRSRRFSVSKSTRSNPINQLHNTLHFTGIAWERPANNSITSSTGAQKTTSQQAKGTKPRAQFTHRSSTNMSTLIQTRIASLAVSYKRSLTPLKLLSH